MFFFPIERFVGNLQEIIFWLFLKHLFLQIESVLFLKKGMVLCPCFKEQFHPDFDVFLNLQLFLFQIFLQQFRTVLDEHVSIEKIILAPVSNVDDFKSAFNFSFIVIPVP